jgi:Ca-activated chloride channel family protein
MKALGMFFVFILFWSGVRAQHPNKLLREGLAAYKNGDYTVALNKYNQAMGKESDKVLTHYNLGAAYYKAGKADSAMMHWQTVATGQDNPELQAKAWHNIGNAFVKQRNFEKAVDAYKRSLKINPDDEDTRYNLAYSQRQMQAQQNQNQKQNQNQQNQNQQNQDQKQKEQDKQQEPKQNKPEEQPQDEKLSKELAERMLKALDNKEKDLHGRKKEKGEGNPANPQKDW